jgi:hypothetical protein
VANRKWKNSSVEPGKFDGTGRHQKKDKAPAKGRWSHNQFAVEHETNGKPEPLPVQFYKGAIIAASQIIEAQEIGITHPLDGEILETDLRWARAVLAGKEKADYISTCLLNEATQTKTCRFLVLDLHESLADDVFKTTEGALDWPKIGALLLEKNPAIFHRISDVTKSLCGKGLSIFFHISPFELGRYGCRGVERFASIVLGRLHKVFSDYGLGVDDSAHSLERYVPNFYNPQLRIDTNRDVTRDLAESRRDRVLSDLFEATRSHFSVAYVRKSARAMTGEVLHQDLRVERKLVSLYQDLAAQDEAVVMGFSQIQERTGIAEDTLRKILKHPPAWLEVRRVSRGRYSLKVIATKALSDRVELLSTPKLAEYKLCWPEEVADGERYKWLGDLLSHLKQHGVAISDARKVLSLIIPRIPGGSSSRTFTVNLDSCMASIYGNRCHGDDNTFGIRKDPMVRWVSDALRFAASNNDPSTPSPLTPKTSNKKGIPTESSLYPTRGSDPGFLFSVPQASLPQGPEASPREGGQGGEGFSPPPNTLCPSALPVSVPTPSGFPVSDAGFDTGKSEVHPASRAALPPLSLEGVLSGENISAALAGAAVKAGPKLLRIWSREGAGILDKVRAGRYQPAPVRINTPKDGSTRVTVSLDARDKVLQKALTAVLKRHFDSTFSRFSFAYRQGGGTAKALKAAQGKALTKPWVLCLDIQKCFDSVDHERLMGFLGERIADADLLQFIRAALSISQVKGLGLPQGGPASNFLSNVYLDRLDRFLAAKGIEFCRYSDDVRAFFKSKADADKALDEVRVFLESELGLLLNEKKTRIDRAECVRFVGGSLVDESRQAPAEAPADLISREEFSAALRLCKALSSAERGQILEELIGLSAEERQPFMCQWLKTMQSLM